MVLAADARSTSGSTVADKNCEKIHFIAPNIYCCGAGTAADTENVTGARLGPGCAESQTSSSGHRQARVATAVATAEMIVVHSL